MVGAVLTGHLLRMVRGDGRYARVAPWYDLLSAEPVYRTGRRAAIEQLALEPGDQVLDLGCGTGLNFASISDAIGPGGRIVGVDASPHMLAQARRRADERGWRNVNLFRADATSLDRREVSRAFTEGRADAVLATYALSLMPDWRGAWEAARDLARPGARLAVVDMRLPTGRARWLTPLARLACALGGSDPSAEPWTAVETDCRDVFAAGVRGGHVQVRVGTRRG